MRRRRSSNARGGLKLEGSARPAIEARGLSKTYPGGVEAVKAVDFNVAPGEMFGLLGPNGAGKSTTVGMLNGTVAPTGGSARLAGFDVATESLAARAVSSVVFQEPVVDRGLTGRRNLQLHARLWGLSPSEASTRVAETAETLGLSELIERTVGTYSGGQRRRLEIARAMVSKPKVLFLDEPTVGLDPRIRHELLDAIADLRTENAMTTLLTTHYLEEAERLCDRVAIIHQGEIVAMDTPKALLRQFGNEIVELRVEQDGPAALAALRARGIAGDHAFAVGSTLTVPLHDRSLGDAIAQVHDTGVMVTAVSSRTPTLDDVYLRLTGDRMAAAA
jgi:ABC-2 type transport system ATP-binding protein